MDPQSRVLSVSPLDHAPHTFCITPATRSTVGQLQASELYWNIDHRVFDTHVPHIQQARTLQVRSCCVLHA